MQNLKQSLTRPLDKAATHAVVVFFVVALLGFADAAYLTVEHYRGVIPPCTTSGCEQVLTSSYATLLGAPVALLGALYYLGLTIAALVYLESKHVTAKVEAHHLAILKWALISTVIGFIGALYFLYLQQFVIRAYCLYCLGSAATSIVLFLTAIVVLKNSHANANIQNTNDQV